MIKISFETLKDLHPKNGELSNSEIAMQRSRYGSNEIIETTGNLWIELIKDTLKDPMIWFLAGIGTIFIFIGNISEATVLFIAMLPLMLMDAVLHWRTQASTASLKNQLASKITVIRQSQKIELDSRELVPGDLIVVSSGLFLPADGIFENTENLQIDESALTGESFPIQKKSTSIKPFTLADAGEVAVHPDTLGYAGTRVLTGQGLLRVVLIGRQTNYGVIVQSVANAPHERTPLQKSITKLVQGLIVASIGFCLILAGVRIYQGHSWLDAILSAATLAVAAIPEEFPVVFTFFLGVGVYRLAKRHALVRRAVSVENIGRVTYICTDKTGTITVGQLKLTHVDPADNLTETDVLYASLTASNPNGSDPVDLAIQEAAQQKAIIVQPQLHTFPFTEDRKREVTIVKSNSQLVAYMKGSPETVFAKSGLSEENKSTWTEKTTRWAREGHKVIACAKKAISQAEFDQGIEPENGFELCGLLAFEDPPRPEVADAITYCRENKINVLMITGDHPDTAAAIAKDIGLGDQSPVVISAEKESEKFNENWLDAHPKFLFTFDVIARCTPLQKLKIVNALKKSGELVAVTGDGVNDVPALKAADIGIAMGQRGTKSAKEVASIILTDDNFNTITNAIMEGRQLFLNLKMSFEYLLLIHIPLVLTAALIPLFGYPLLYLPIHIVWLELIIHPTALLAFQQPATKEKNNLTKQTNFFSWGDIIEILLISALFTAALVFTFLSGLSENLTIDHARAKTLTLLTLWSAGLVVYFTQLKTRMALFIIIATVLCSVMLVQLSFFNQLLHLSSLHQMDWIMTVGIIIAATLLLKIGKWLRFIKSS